MRLFLYSLLFVGTLSAFSQETMITENTPNIKIDSLYREDQFYLVLTLNTLQKKPAGLTQDKFSSGLSFGFLRDFPVNKKRTLAIAPGIGFAINNFNQNLKIIETNQTRTYTIIDSKTAYDKNRFSQILAEVPIEFRWRTSTYESHKFWRIYGGFKMSYLIYDQSTYQDAQGKEEVFNNEDFSKIQYGAYISSGYNSINVYAYYGLNSLFESAKTDSETINMSTLNIGIIFYIL